MHLQTRTLSGPQKVNIFSKRKPVRVRLRFPHLLVVLFGIFVGIFAVWERIHYVRLGYDIALLKQENEALVKEHRTLLLELKTSISLDKVEQRARTTLKMKVPERGQVLYVK